MFCLIYKQVKEKPHNARLAKHFIKIEIIQNRIFGVNTF